MHAFSVQVATGIRLVETAGVPVAEAEDVIVLLNGIPPSARWVDAVARRCHRSVAVLAIDRVSDDLREHVDLAMVLAAFGVVGAVVVGRGESARAAMDLRLHEPARVRSLVLIEPDGLVDLGGEESEASSREVEILCGDSGAGPRVRSDRVTYVPGLDADQMIGTAAGIDATMAAVDRALRRRGAPSPAA